MMLALVACSDKEEAPEGMKDVAPDDAKYNFYVPQNWVTNAEGVVGAYYSGSDKSNISIMAYGGEYTSTDDYFDDFCERAADVFSSFEVVGEKEAKKINEREAVRFCYTMELEGVEYKCMQTVTAYSNIFYVLTYTSTTENYDLHLEDIEKILSEFTFK